MLTQVQTATWNHLQDAADHWENTAQTYREVWGNARSRVANLPWTGEGQTEALAAHTADWTAATTHAEALDAAAAAARTGHGNLLSLRSQLLEQVAQAKQAGYQVSEALTLTPGPKLPLWVAAVDMGPRQAGLLSQAADLVAYDADVAGQVAVSQGGFPVPHSTMMEVGFRTGGPDIAPPDMPEPQPPSVVPRWQQALVAPPPPPAPTPAMPTYTGHPPIMTAVPPGSLLDPPGNGGQPAEENPHSGPVIVGGMTGLVGGCLGGSEIAAAIAAPALPTEIVAPEIGCLGGAVLGLLGPAGGPWVDNAINGNG